MTPEIDAFKKQLNNNPLTNTYLSQIFPRLDQKSTLELSQAIQASSGRYRAYLDFMAEPEAPSNPNVLLKAIFEKLPYFIFSISHSLNTDPKNYDLVRKLLIAGILSIVYRTENLNSPQTFFLKSLDEAADLQTLNKSVFEPGEESSSAARQLYLDLITFAKKQFKYESTKNLLELIEVQFCFLGVTQILFVFYFQLISMSPNDVIALHLDAIFSRIFTLVRLEEINYWKKYKNHQVLQSKIHHIVQMNAPSKRHPHLSVSLRIR